jgi:hypothetical protein
VDYEPGSDPSYERTDWQPDLDHARSEAEYFRNEELYGNPPFGEVYIERRQATYTEPVRLDEVKAA